VQKILSEVRSLFACHHTTGIFYPGVEDLVTLVYILAGSALKEFKSRDLAQFFA